MYICRRPAERVGPATWSVRLDSGESKEVAETGLARGRKCDPGQPIIDEELLQWIKLGVQTSPFLAAWFVNEPIQKIVAVPLRHHDVPMVWRHERIIVNLPHADELEAGKKLMWAAQEVEKVAAEATPFKVGITANPPQRLSYYDKDAADGVLAKMYIVAVSKVREETSQIEASLIREFSKKCPALCTNLAPGGEGSCRMKGGGRAGGRTSCPSWLPRAWAAWPGHPPWGRALGQ